ncbi:5',5'''-P-1,P-4-tetraphosphate phosphorylase 2 [Choanephora cucurbitarum]|uniref:5',5'''-P-1,P-4-tetraphosphate phosphorylase 2 n=1 Tax=Choanephora cucurbitarum TaxID=101091 RepID=A0A1C7NL49_9FUNG|nr:5',5'''-P-1,P-4-tetraphosphate phosphorylase 2 [Choanephora cucurbitarum]
MMNLFQEVQTKFNAAKESGDLISFDSTQVVKESGGIKFTITLAPALAKKEENKKENQQKEEKPNPFLNPNPALVIQETEEHRLLLNKFAVIPNHLLIVTKEFHKQTEPLFPNDLYETYQALQGFGMSRPALAFFNCGNQSGASQGHKHVQVLPLEYSQSAQPPIKQLYDEIHDRHIGQIYAINKLPFVHVIMALDSNAVRQTSQNKEALSDYLGQMFFGILDAMFQQLRENSLPMDTSYNFLMTQEFMMLIPRRKEVATIEHNGKTFEFSINSLGFAGLMLCKTEEELAALEAQENLMDMLTQVGVAWDPQSAKYDAERQMAASTELA